MRSVRRMVWVGGMVVGFVVATPAAAVAQEAGPSVEQVMLDTMWTLVAAFLVFFLPAGFAMVEAGLTRQKNAANIVMKNLMDFGLSSIAFWAVGFAFMFGAGNAHIETTGFFLGAGRVRSTRWLGPRHR